MIPFCPVLPHTPQVHTWIVRFEQPKLQPPSNFLVGLAPPGMDVSKSLGEEGCGIGLDYYGYFYVNGRYFHASNLASWSTVAKPVRGSTAKHKGEGRGAHEGAGHAGEVRAWCVCYCLSVAHQCRL